MLVDDRGAQLVTHPHRLATLAPAATAGKVSTGRRTEHADVVGVVGQLCPADDLVGGLVEREEPVSAIVEAGFDRDTVARIERLLHIAEYKRRQAAPGVKDHARVRAFVKAARC